MFGKKNEFLKEVCLWRYYKSPSMSTLLKIDCADKKNHHLDGLASTKMPHFPSKILACGRSGGGNGSAAKQLLLTAVPAYGKIYVVHYCPESTDEWADCELSSKLTVDSWPDDPSEFYVAVKETSPSSSLLFLFLFGVEFPLWVPQ